MELSFTTFILELINFLVLVWILKRLFFVPIKEAIEERKAFTLKTLKDAQKVKMEAEGIRVQYESSLQTWESEKVRAWEAFGKTISEERGRRLKELEVSLERERQKIHTLIERETRAVRNRVEQEAMRQSLEFVRRLFGELVSPELEARLIKLALDHIHESPVQSNIRTRAQTCRVHTAFEPTEQQKKTIQNAIKTFIETDCRVEFSTDRSLLAGIEILLDSTVIRANLRDELSLFSEVGKS